MFLKLIYISKTEKIPKVTSKFLFHVRTRLLNMTWSNLGSMLEGLLLPWQQIYHLAFYSILRTTPEVSSKLYFVEYIKSQRSYGFLITKELIFGVQILDLKDTSQPPQEKPQVFELGYIKVKKNWKH